MIIILKYVMGRHGEREDSAAVGSSQGQNNDNQEEEMVPLWAPNSKDSFFKF